MSNTNKKSINYGLKILVILAFGLIFSPAHTTMAAYGTNSSDYIFGYRQEINNPKPYLNSISPKSGNRSSTPKTITVTGGNFFPGSIARVNGANRYTTFIDDSHLLVHLTANDMYLNDSFFVTVFNGAPGGGYSNAETFTIYESNDAGANNSYNGNYNNDNYYNTTNNTSNVRTNTNGKYSNLASNVIYGGNSFFPSGLVQWILLAIIILIIIILARRVFGATDNYHSSPLKHE